MQIFLLNKTEKQRGWLDEEEAKHCLKVLRHQPGDEIYTVDGQGNMYLARIEKEVSGGLELSFVQKHENWGEKDINISLAVSPLRLKDRFEWLIEKSVELGVNEIFPISCQRTDKFKSKFKADRLEKIILTALKQCKRSLIPTLHPIQPLKEFINNDKSEGRFLASGDAEQMLQNYSEKIKTLKSISLLVGPEGDFTESEVKMAREKKYIPVSLGENRLRTETAGMYGLAVFKMIYGF